MSVVTLTSVAFVVCEQFSDFDLSEQLFIIGSLSVVTLTAVAIVVCEQCFDFDLNEQLFVIRSLSVVTDLNDNCGL